VVFLGVLYGDEPRAARAFLQRQASSYPTLVDPAQRIVVDYGVGGVPETYFIDREGTVKAKYTGPLDHSTLSALLGSIR
jgi:cytochrome c biogenesis protein CcmG/thiol:disulfide interchange protein DsbE